MAPDAPTEDPRLPLAFDKSVPWLAPGPLVAVALLLVNDHVLKGAGVVPAVITGKLSDVAGLAVFPLLLATLMAWSLGRTPGWRGRGTVRTVAVAATALGFSAVKLFPALAALATRTWGPIVADATDLLALPALALAWRWLDPTRAEAAPPPPDPRAAIAARHEGGGWTAAARVVVVALAATASIATPAPRFVRNYPHWELDGATVAHLDCADATAWVSKSGKEGVGVTVRLERRGADGGAPGPCRIAVDAATFRVAGTDVVVAAHSLPAPVSLDGPHFVYLAFPFDNNSLWNEGKRTGRLDLVFATASGAKLFDVAATHRLRGFYKERER